MASLSILRRSRNDKFDAVRLHGTCGTKYNKGHHLLCITKLTLPSIFRSTLPPAPPLLGLYGAPQVSGRHGAATWPLGRPGWGPNDAQVAGVYDDFTKVQHGRLEDTNNGGFFLKFDFLWVDILRLIQ